MIDTPLATIRQQIQLAKNNELKTILQQLQSDKRKGAKQLSISIEKKLEWEKKETERLFAMRLHEESLYQLSYQSIAGCDEVGRGPLAGPVCVGMVILSKGCTIPRINDSKCLSKKRREELAAMIEAKAEAVSFAFVDAPEIDTLGIVKAITFCIAQAYDNLPIRPDYILFDENMKPSLTTPYHFIKKGDRASQSIAAASIIAKTKRDAYMEKISQQYPNYFFEKNKGYGSVEHIEAIKKYGITPYHRLSFLKNYIES